MENQQYQKQKSQAQQEDEEFDPEFDDPELKEILMKMKKEKMKEIDESNSKKKKEVGSGRFDLNSHLFSQGNIEKQLKKNSCLRSLRMSSQLSISITWISKDAKSWTSI